MTLAYRSAAELAALIKAKKAGSEELLDLYLDRFEKYNSRVNAIIATDFASARRRAKAADAALAKGENWGPLHGIPMTIKDSFDVAGMPSTWGVVELKDHRPARNALAVDRFVDAGAIFFGKTNVPAFLIGWATNSEVHGTTNNPWDLTRSPGGSSGGSAAAIATGLSALEIGVDFGGGVRNVAHYCGIYGHKPTYGITNWVGHVLPGFGTRPDLAVNGPIARSAADLKLALSLMAGADPSEAIAWKLTLPQPRANSWKDLRVAVMLEDTNFEVDTDVQDRIQAVADFMAKKGAKVDDKARPAIDTEMAFRIFGGLLMAGLAIRKDDEKFWTRLQHLRARFMGAAGSGAAEQLFTHAQWLQLDNARQLLRQAWAEFFRDHDVLLCPAAPTVAVPHDPKHAWHERKIMVKGRQTSPADPTFWGALATGAYLPATVAPAGLSRSGLPVGVQIMGPAYSDLTCIAVAERLEREFQGFVPPKGWD
jgi:amidase